MQCLLDFNAYSPGEYKGYYFFIIIIVTIKIFIVYLKTRCICSSFIRT